MRRGHDLCHMALIQALSESSAGERTCHLIAAAVLLVRVHGS